MLEAFNLAAHINSQIHYAKGTQSDIPPKGHSPPTACKYMVSDTISLPYSGYFSLSAHATGSLPVVGKYLALEGGPSEFIPGFTCPVLLGCDKKEIHIFHVQDFHLLRLLFPKHSTKYKFGNSSPE